MDEGTRQGGPLSAVDAASSLCTPQMCKIRASGRGAGRRIMERRTGQGWREWAEIMPDRDAELARPPAAGLGSQSVLVALRRCTIYGLYDESPAWTHSAFGSWSADPLQCRL